VDEHYQVVIVRYGTRTATRREVYLNYGVYDEPDAPIGMDYFFWVIRNGQHTLVLDTGFSRAGGEKRQRTMLIEPTSALRLLGIGPEELSTVLISHAHYDHIGNLAAFVSSDLVIAEGELAFWQSEYATRAQFRHSADDAGMAALATAESEGRVRTFTGAISLLPGIEMVEVGGHTPGQSVVVVDTSEGRVVLASDATHYYEELDRDMPFAFVADLVQTYAGLDRLRDIMGEDGASHLVTGHDPSTFQRFRSLADIPADLHGHAVSIGSLT
jgi:glyoxylase-like metal-dependent hydrolase (beta-lactamase superfamily II)